MLYLSTVDPSTLELLKSLMKVEPLSGTRLVGGTALALQIGHRKSIDLDFFGNIDFESIDKFAELQGTGIIQTLKTSKNINILTINGIKVDFVHYQYPWLEEQMIVDGIRLGGLKDIAAMKLAAITGRGSKKDFIDIFFLLNRFTLEEMIGFYNEKYFDGSEYMLIKSLTYFDDAEEDISPEMIQETKWKEVKDRISQEVIKYFN